MSGRAILISSHDPAGAVNGGGFVRARSPFRNLDEEVYLSSGFENVVELKEDAIRRDVFRGRLIEFSVGYEMDGEGERKANSRTFFEVSGFETVLSVFHTRWFLNVQGHFMYDLEKKFNKIGCD
jgi:hypothetical protein